MAAVINDFGLQIQTFSSTINLLLQQRKSMIRDAVTVIDGLVGSNAQVIRQLAAIQARKVAGRLEPIIADETFSDARNVQPTDYDWAGYEDSFEKLRTNDNGLMMAMSTAAVAAMGRAMDSEIVSGIFGINYTGSTGTGALTPVPFDSTQVVPVTVGSGGGTATRMNMQKIIQGRKILTANYALDTDEPVSILMTAEQIANLMNDQEVISGDYQYNKVLANGQLTSVAGVNIIHYENLPLDANGYRRNPMFVKSGVALGIWRDLTIDISQRRDMRGVPFQFYSMMTLGATRTEEKKVVEIKNTEV